MNIATPKSVITQSHLDSLEDQVTQYKQVLDVMPAGVILLDTQGMIREANLEAHRILQVELVGQRWLNIISQVFDPKDDDGHEISLYNGLKVQLGISASTTGQLILITDLTQTRLLQSRISDLQRLSSLGKMVASLAHQVRTPLASAMLYASNLTSDSLPHATRKRFNHKLIDRLHDLEKQVNDMLLFAKGGSNKVVETFDIYNLIAQFDPMIATAILNNNVNYEQIIEIDENDELTILGNPNTLASAMSNLVLNAIDMIGNNAKITLRIYKRNDEIHIAVQDNGPGVPTYLHEKIMEPFFTTRSQGTGLGLAVVQMVCRAHNGRLELDSKENNGACFTICLPYKNTIKHGAGK